MNGGHVAIALTLVALTITSALIQPAVVEAAGGGEYTRSCTVPIAAVSSSGGGVIGRLTVKVSYPGSGKVYISTSPASEVDTQGSARIAAFAASLLAGVDMLDYDFYYDVESPSIIIGGPSAGSAMALATYQLLVRGECASGVVATGMIQPDTSIGPVGGLKEKLEATASEGGSVFIIPAGQEVYTYMVRRVERSGPLIRIVEEPVTVDLKEYGEKLGVKVVSASTLEEAYRLGILGEDATQETPTTIQLPPRVREALEDYIIELNSTLNKYLASLGGVSSRYIESLVEAAESHESKSVELLKEGSVYAAAVEMVLATMTAEKAYAISYALNHELDVTVFVNQANKTLNNAWDRASGMLEGVKYSIQADSMMKAYAKVGLASYYYSQGVSELVKRVQVYKLPYSIITGVDPSGVEHIITAKWLASWSMLWSNMTAITTPGGVEIDWDRVGVVSKLLLAQAKTTTAYVEALLQESGAGRGAEVSAYLADLAMSVQDNPLAVIGLAIESIAESTRIIHEVFTLDPSRTESNLERLAYRIADETSDVGLQPMLLLEAAQHSNETIEKLLTVSRAILYGWAVNEITRLSSGGAGGGGETKTAEIEITTETSTVTTTETNTVTRTITETIQARSGQNTGMQLESLLIGFILGIAAYWAITRRTRP